MTQDMIDDARTLGGYHGANVPASEDTDDEMIDTMARSDAQAHWSSDTPDEVVQAYLVAHRRAQRKGQ